MKDAERRSACADKASKHRKQAERFVEDVGEVTTRERVVGAQNSKRNKQSKANKESEKENNASV